MLDTNNCCPQQQRAENIVAASARQSPEAAVHYECLLTATHRQSVLYAIVPRYREITR